MAISCSSNRSEIGLARAVAAAVLLVVCISVTGSASGAEAAVNVEDIHVVRSVRLSRVPATDFCSIERTGFGNATIERSIRFSCGPDEGVRRQGSRFDRHHHWRTARVLRPILQSADFQFSSQKVLWGIFRSSAEVNADSRGGTFRSRD